MDLALLVLVLVVVAVLIFCLWRRYVPTTGTPCSPCTTTTTGTVCFPGTTYPVKSGLIDLRNCTDDVYIFANQSKVHFIQEV